MAASKKSKAAQKKSSSEAPAAPPSLAKLQVLGKQKTSEYLHAHNTNVKYQQQAANAQKWLAGFFAQEEEAEKGGSLTSGAVQPGHGESSSESESLPLFRDPEFRTALTGPPVKCTPTAVAMYLVYKCFEQDLKNATAVQIHAALIRQYDQMDGDTYRGRWHYNEARKMWMGNPVRSAEVDDVMVSIKHKDGLDGGDRKHSLAMSKKYMEQLYLWSTALCPPQNITHLPRDGLGLELRAIHLRFRARASLGFTIWTRSVLTPLRMVRLINNDHRNCESTQLQYKHLEFDGERRRGGTPLDPPHFEVNLKNRKNWQRKQDKNQSVCGHNYKIYPQPQSPALDVYMHMLDWLDYYELLLGRPLQDNDYIFPFIGTDCKVHAHKAMSSDLVQKELNDFAQQAGMRGAGSFTTHCYRRGGAQYRFMFAPVGERWTLARIRWWGGWAEKEHRDMLIRYLLDELYNYEEDHSDALCPISRNATESLMGEAGVIRPASFADLHQFASRIEEREPLVIQRAVHQGVSLSLATILPLLVSSSTTPHPCASTMPGGANNGSSTFSQTPPIPTGPVPTPRREALFSRGMNLQFGAHPAPSVPVVPYHSPPPPPPPARPNPAWVIPDVRGREAWRIVVRDWENTDSSRSLAVPLRDWTKEQVKQGGASIYKHREIVALEFIEVYKRDEEKFKAAYPEHELGVSHLLSAIRQARATRGASKQRRSKNGTPEERARRFGLSA